MRAGAPYQTADLDELDARLFARAAAVVPMRDIAAGQADRELIGLRHDVDNVIEPAVAFAEWEAARGYRSTYFVLHTAAYWRNEPLLRRSLERIAELGHEIGIHNNAVAEATEMDRDPVDILAGALERLRWFGHDVTGTVAHGDPRCYGRDGQVSFVNDELFSECSRPTYRTPARPPVPLSYFGLDYDANWLPRGAYLSDSGGRWSQPFARVADSFPYPAQLHVLVHADWWPEAFNLREAA